MEDPQPSSSPLPDVTNVFDTRTPWAVRLEFVLEMMRDLSNHTEPMDMVKSYARHIRRVVPYDTYVSMSRRGLEYPHFRITRSEAMGRDFDPWTNPHQVPQFEGGLLAELIYGEEPAVIDDLRLEPSDPAAPYLQGVQSLVAIPLYDNGKSLNMSIIARRGRAAFDRQLLPALVALSNLFGRAAHAQVLRRELGTAYESLDRELRVVADIQRSLLPAHLPSIPNLELSAYYHASARAGGDYYDIFPLMSTANKHPCSWGILLADVSGHGPPAAVMMAITHSIAHLGKDLPGEPASMLQFINQNLAARYTADNGRFVTGIYGVWEPNSRTLRYANAGHPPPLRRSASGQVRPLGGERSLPLGLEAVEEYVENTQRFEPGETLLMFTDGITESRRGVEADLFGEKRLAQALASCDGSPKMVIERVLHDLKTFTDGAPAVDDRTLLVLKVR